VDAADDHGRTAKPNLSHSARFVGKGLEKLYEGLGIAGWSGGSK
jgi:hypothetical protein